MIQGFRCQAQGSGYQPRGLCFSWSFPAAGQVQRLGMEVREVVEVTGPSSSFRTEAAGLACLLWAALLVRLRKKGSIPCPCVQNCSVSQQSGKVNQNISKPTPITGSSLVNWENTGRLDLSHEQHRLLHFLRDFFLPG